MADKKTLSDNLRKRTEDAIRESEKRFRDIVTASADWVWEVDMDCTYVFASGRVKDVLGYEPEEIIGRTPFELMPPDEAERVRNEFQAIAHRQEPFRDLANDNLHKNGGIRHILTSGVPIFDAQGELRGYRGVDKDDTERKNAEKSLFDSEERLHFALETCHTGAWDLDLLDHTVFSSLEHDRIFGYPEPLPEWTYEKFLGHVLPEDRATVDGTFRQAMENRSDWNFECRIRRTDGLVRWILAAGRHRQNAVGTPLRMAGIIQDITDRKRVEEEIIQLNNDLEKRVIERTAALAQANEKLSQEIAERKQMENSLRVSNEEWLNTFNASSDPIFLLDTNHHIMRANKALAAMVDLPVEEIIGRLCHKIIHGSDAPITLCPQCLLLEDYHSHTAEVFVEKLCKYILVTVSPIFDPCNTLLGSIHYAKDITSIKAAEKVLANAKNDLEHKVTERTAELAQAHEQMKRVSFELIWAEEKERERIAAELHDQVGQSLLLAKMKLDALEDKLSDDTLHTYAMEAASLIETSIHDIRSLTFRMRPPILDTAGIETALEWLCSSISNDYSIQVDFTDDCQQKPRLSTEMRYSLYQAVRELLLNVVKHAGTEKAHVSITCENQMIVVQVADNGIGFNHPDAIMKHVHNGGYGLYNVRQRIKQMGGRFVVESAPGQGTSVTLMVPLTES